MTTSTKNKPEAPFLDEKLIKRLIGARISIIDHNELVFKRNGEGQDEIITLAFVISDSSGNENLPASNGLHIKTKIGEETLSIS